MYYASSVTCLTLYATLITHLFVSSLGHAHHEEEEAGETEPLHRGDEEEGVGCGVRPTHGRRHQLDEVVGAQA